MRQVIALIFFALITFPARAQITPLSTWVNTRGSTLTVWFVDAASGAFWGTYVNNAVGFKCQNQPYESKGLTKGEAVTFTVNWSGFAVQNCKSTTTWRGGFVGLKLRTRWTLDYVGNDAKIHYMRGADIFTRR